MNRQTKVKLIRKAPGRLSKLIFSLASGNVSRLALFVQAYLNLPFIERQLLPCNWARLADALLFLMRRQFIQGVQTQDWKALREAARSLRRGPDVKSVDSLRSRICALELEARSPSHVSDWAQFLRYKGENRTLRKALSDCGITFYRRIDKRTREHFRQEFRQRFRAAEADQDAADRLGDLSRSLEAVEARVGKLKETTSGNRTVSGGARKCHFANLSRDSLPQSAITPRQ
jgi:hypothetical protein